MDDLPVPREFYSEIGRKGGRSKSPKKIRRAMKNLAKARELSSKFKAEKRQLMALRSSATKMLKRDLAELLRESWLLDTWVRDPEP